MADVGGQMVKGMSGGASSMMQVLTIKEFWVCLGVALLVIIGAFDLMVLTNSLPAHFYIWHLTSSIKYYATFHYLLNPISIGLIASIIICIILFVLERTQWIISKIIFPIIAVLTFGIFIIGITALALTFYSILIIIIMAAIYSFFCMRCIYPTDSFLRIFAFIMLFIPILYVVLNIF